MPTLPDDAWAELRDDMSAGWFVGRPSHDARRGLREQHAFDPREPAQAGARSLEWTAGAPTQVEVIRELARCLRLIRNGQAPG
jgi:hypothetical protein